MEIARKPSKNQMYKKTRKIIIISSENLQTWELAFRIYAISRITVNSVTATKIRTQSAM